MKCPRCKRGIIPKCGRAARHALCCKCDREIFGPQNDDDKAEKGEIRSRQKRMSKNQIFAMMEKAYAAATSGKK